MGKASKKKAYILVSLGVPYVEKVGSPQEGLEEEGEELLLHSVGNDPNPLPGDGEELLQIPPGRLGPVKITCALWRIRFRKAWPWQPSRGKRWLSRKWIRSWTVTIRGWERK